MVVVVVNNRAVLLYNTAAKIVRAQWMDGPRGWMGPTTAEAGRRAAPVRVRRRTVKFIRNRCERDLERESDSQ